MQVIHIIAMLRWCKLTYIINFNAGISHAIYSKIIVPFSEILPHIYSTGLKGVV